MKDVKVSAIVLAGGQGKRMQSDRPKQYLLIHGRPVLYHTLKAFEDSSVDEIILVCQSGEETYCKEEIVSKYDFHKVTKIVPGGAERYNSVYNGLLAIGACDYVLIHDGARPLVGTALIERNIEAVKQYRACVTAVPSKDTVKISDADGFVSDTPKRSLVWNVQTPQSFEYDLIRDAYEKIFKMNTQNITDDAMVLENTSEVPIKLVEGSYTNIKVTTPEDLDIAELFVGK